MLILKLPDIFFFFFFFFFGKSWHRQSIYPMLTSDYVYFTKKKQQHVNGVHLIDFQKNKQINVKPVMSDGRGKNGDGSKEPVSEQS